MKVDVMQKIDQLVQAVAGDTDAATVATVKTVFESVYQQGLLDGRAQIQLRDQFAAAALSGLIHHYQSDEAIGPNPLPDLARTSFDYADAMLKAREVDQK